MHLVSHFDEDRRARADHPGDRVSIAPSRSPRATAANPSRPRKFRWRRAERSERFVARDDENLSMLTRRDGRVADEDGRGGLCGLSGRRRGGRNERSPELVFALVSSGENSPIAPAKVEETRAVRRPNCAFGTESSRIVLPGAETRLRNYASRNCITTRFPRAEKKTRSEINRNYGKTLSEFLSRPPLPSPLSLSLGDLSVAKIRILV